MTNVKKQRGGKRKGSGRKPIKIEEGVKAAILKAVSKDPEQIDRVWKKVMDRAEKGSYPHIQILFNYFYGRPIENVNVSTKQMVLKRIIVNE